MSHAQRQWLIAGLGVLLIAAGSLWWYANFEKRWVARHHVSDALRDNPMLAATRLLSGRGFTVTSKTTLREALLKPLPQGTLLIAENGGIVSAEQVDRMLAWVRQGNTLIMRPKGESSEAADAGDDDGKRSGNRNRQRAEQVEADPLGARFGVALKPADCDCKKASPAPAKDPAADASAGSSKEAESSTAPADRLADFTLPGATYPLQLDASYYSMKPYKPGPRPLHGDAAGDVVRVYAEGRGYVVLLAQNYFDNDHLARYDHAEMLLGLAGLAKGTRPGQPSAQGFLIVRGLDMAKWYEALWDNFWPGLIGIGCVLLLLLWTALRRFGPTLPEPVLERRSLIEHIDASGRWFWKLAGGRKLLLGAARAAANKAWQRRRPELLRLHRDLQIERLSQDCHLAAADLVSALRHPAGKTPAAFTRQIQTLRQLRKSHER
ncbi:MAG TPA: hypothetical protein DHV59_19115 [Oxalobacteraceae bacterium]|nr:hypothetical protein [Oxalobacteraceae bacterium]